MRAAFAGVVALILAGCSLLRPDDRPTPDAVKDFFTMMGEHSGGGDPRFVCSIDVERSRLLARAVDPRGGPDYQWWAAPTDGGGSADVVTQIDDAGREVGGSGGGCGIEPDASREDGLWWSGGGGDDRSVVHGGYVPDGAAAARLTFGDHPPVIVEANEEGYFLVVLAEDACCEWSFPDLLEALDADRGVIASESP